jgi:hypothetical protein
VPDVCNSMEATLLTGRGVVDALCALFECQWDKATVLGDAAPRAPRWSTKMISCRRTRTVG